jgi:hypothetical protein
VGAAAAEGAGRASLDAMVLSVAAVFRFMLPLDEALRLFRVMHWVSAKLFLECKVQMMLVSVVLVSNICSHSSKHASPKSPGWSLRLMVVRAALCASPLAKAADPSFLILFFSKFSVFTVLLAPSAPARKATSASVISQLDRFMLVTKVFCFKASARPRQFSFGLFWNEALLLRSIDVRVSSFFAASSIVCFGVTPPNVNFRRDIFQGWLAGWLNFNP